MLDRALRIFVALALTAGIVCLSNAQIVSVNPPLGLPSATGDITFTNAGVGTIANGAVTLGKTANLAANSIIGNNTGAPATPLALTQAQLTAMVNAATATLSGALPAFPNNTTTYFRGDGTYQTHNCAALTNSAASCATDATNAANIASGTLPAGRMPALTGAVTSSAGSTATTINTTLPTRQYFTTAATNQTYTTPAGARYIRIRMCGGGAGGAGGGTGNGAGGAGGNTCWNTSGAACTTPVFQTSGGPASNTAGSAVGGGGIAGSGSPWFLMTGQTGGGADQVANAVGGNGGSSPLGFGGPGGVGGNTAGGAAVGFCAGGGGGTTSLVSPDGGGGPAGGYLEVTITNPAATYTYTVGAAGTAGSAGTSGALGGVGTAGAILIDEFYNFLLKRDLDPANDNTPMFLDIAA